MKRKKIKKPTLLETAHEIAKDLYAIKLIDDSEMRKFDALCFLPAIEQLSPKQIKQLRIRKNATQPVFAKFLNTSVSTVKQWEQGEKQPRGISLKLLDLVKQKGLDILLPYNFNQG